MLDGNAHKMLALIHGVPLVRIAAECSIASTAERTYVVTGYMHEAVEERLSGLAVDTVYNADFATGMASSIVSGLKAQGAQDADGILILLADMPAVSSVHLDALIDTFCKAGGCAIVRASFGDHAGNPVVLPRILYPRLLELEGDRGAQRLIETCGLDVLHVEIGPAASIDIDTEADLRAVGGVLPDPVLRL